MTEYSVAAAKNGLPGLIDKARAGEQVIITRDGRAVAELRPLEGTKAGSGETYGWLRAQRQKRKPVSVTSVTLIREMYEEPH